MEALTAVAVAALTIYDMVKAVDRGMAIEGIRLLEKRGGRSGSYRARSPRKNPQITQIHRLNRRRAWRPARMCAGTNREAPTAARAGVALSRRPRRGRAVSDAISESYLCNLWILFPSMIS